MIVFFDTSALVKFFSEEAGSDQISALINDSRNELWIFELTLLEYRSALHRKLRNREITREAFEIAESGFTNEMARFQIEPFSRATIRQAEQLMATYGKSKHLRTLDSLQAAAFTLIAEPDWIFITADDVLADTIQAMGHRSLNPLGMA
jgi:uncharacterized protein with PIN domain